MCLPAWFLAGRLAQQIKLPLITGYLVAGAVSGPSLLQLFRANGLASLGFVDHTCLGVIALAAGAELRVSELKKTKRQVIASPPGRAMQTQAITCVDAVLCYCRLCASPLASHCCPGWLCSWP